MKQKVVVVGSGAREHAIVLKLLHSSRVATIFALPGNPGIRKSDESRVVSLGEFECIG